jgi:hypothetical protein
MVVVALALEAFWRRTLTVNSLFCCSGAVNRKFQIDWYVRRAEVEADLGRTTCDWLKELENTLYYFQRHKQSLSDTDQFVQAKYRALP